jgi:hypothetical protein
MGSMPNSLPSTGGTQEMRGPTVGATPHPKYMPISPVLSSHWHDAQIPRSHLTGMTLNVPNLIPQARHPNPFHPWERCGVPTVGTTPHPNACLSCHSSHPTGVASNSPSRHTGVMPKPFFPLPSHGSDMGPHPRGIVISSGVNTFRLCCFSCLTRR